MTMDRPTFDQWFAENYKAYGVAELFDKLKAADAAQVAATNGNYQIVAGQIDTLKGRLDKFIAYIKSLPL